MTAKLFAVMYILFTADEPIDFSKANTGTDVQTRSISFDPEKGYCKERKLENHSTKAK